MKEKENIETNEWSLRWGEEVGKNVQKLGRRKKNRCKKETEKQWPLFGLY